MKYTLLLQAAQIKTITLRLTQLFVNNNNNNNNNKLYLKLASISLTVLGALQNLNLNSKKSNNDIYKYKK